MTAEGKIKIISPKEAGELDRTQAIYGAAIPVYKGHMPGEGITQLHPDDAIAIEERRALLKTRQEIHARAFASGIPSFRRVEPNGGYDLNHEPGDEVSAENIVFRSIKEDEENPNLEKTA